MPVAASTKKDRFASAAEDVAAAERAIQKEIDRKEKTRPKTAEKSKGAMQAGARAYPEPPFPKQHEPKPGSESELQLKPMYDAPHYKGSEKLKGKVALITGADSGIGRAVAVLFAGARRATVPEPRSCFPIADAPRLRGSEAMCIPPVTAALRELGFSVKSWD